MRTTVDLPDDLLAQAKKLAAESHRTLSAVIQDALREALAPRRRPAKLRPVKLITFGGAGLHPGVELDDAAALLDLMDTAAEPP